METIRRVNNIQANISIFDLIPSLSIIFTLNFYLIYSKFLKDSFELFSNFVCANHLFNCFEWTNNWWAFRSCPLSSQSLPPFPVICLINPLLILPLDVSKPHPPIALAHWPTNIQQNRLLHVLPLIHLHQWARFFFFLVFALRIEMAISHSTFLYSFPPSSLFLLW